MKRFRSLKGFTLLEIMVSAGIFSLVTFAILVALDGMHSTMSFESRMESVDSNATSIIEKMGRDFRECSYAYVYAGDYFASKDALGVVTIEVARNYLSSNPFLTGTSLSPDINNEGWGQCPNGSCPWRARTNTVTFDPIEPKAFLGQIVRNNPQVQAPTYPPPSLLQNQADGRGRLYGHLNPGDECPSCGTILSSTAYFSGVLLFSPRRADGSFSYTDSGDTPLWESMIFYCPYKSPQGNTEIRRYVFYASSLDANASLVDFLDFDANEIIESPPMTDTLGDFVMDAEGENFSLGLNGGQNMLNYTKWDNASGRSFGISVDRATGSAALMATGGPFGFVGIKTVSLEMMSFASGLSDFEVSYFINNPSWDGAGGTVNELGVMETGAVRVSIQVDKTRITDLNPMETVQSIMFRPRN